MPIVEFGARHRLGLLMRAKLERVQNAREGCGALSPYFSFAIFRAAPGN